MKFTPFLLQGSLAAGGVALMPFNYLQFIVPHGKGSITLSDISWETLTGFQAALYLPLVAIMLLFIVIHFLFTVTLLKNLIQWVSNKEDYNNFINNPLVNVGVLAPIASLAMTANIIWGPLGFFVPQVSANLQSLMFPSLLFFTLLWIILFKLEFKILKIWLSESADMNKLNFVWLVDAFAFGVVSLAGSGIASISTNSQIASLAAFGSLFTLAIGFFIFITKLIYLLYLQIKSTSLPDKSVLPAHFLVIPLTCLFGLSSYRITMYLQTHFSMEVKGLSFFTINFSYVIAITWLIFSIYLFSDYLKNDFVKSKFSPPQWGMV